MNNKRACFAKARNSVKRRMERLEGQAITEEVKFQLFLGVWSDGVWF